MTSDSLNRSKKRHLQVIALNPIYEETSHWTPVLCSQVTLASSAERLAWVEARGLVRGTKVSRNDYLVPVDGLWLFKDPAIAMEFKMLWG